MRLIGEKARGATLTSDESTECLDEFNTFMDATATERLLCYQLVQDSKALTASTNSYTIGTNGTFAVTRPVKIVDPCFVRDSAGLDTPLEIIDAATYGNIVMKGAGYTYPTKLFYDSGFSATSTGTIYLYPSPSGSLTLFINSWKQLGTVSSMSQNIYFPPGYQLFIESNFAVHLAAGFKPISAELAKMVRDSKAMVKSVNIPETTMYVEAGIIPGHRSNIFTGP
jgi:hypothetical protein